MKKENTTNNLLIEVYLRTLLLSLTMFFTVLRGYGQTRDDVNNFLAGGYVESADRSFKITETDANGRIVLFNSCEKSPTKLVFRLEYKIPGESEANIPEGWRYNVSFGLFNGAGDPKGTYDFSIDRMDSETMVDAKLHDELLSCYDGYYFTLLSAPETEGESVSEAIPNIHISVYRYQQPTSLSFDRESPLGLTSSVSPVSKEIRLDWDPTGRACVVEYELSWLHVDAHSSDHGSITASALPSLFTKGGATARPVARVVTDKNNFSMPKAYPEGFVVFRVRGVGLDENNNKIKTAWSTPVRIDIDASNAESNKNWQVVSTFAEGGKQKKVVSYFDGLGKSRQTLTNLSSISTTLVTESMYDFEGRPAVEVLPAPLVGNIDLGYKEDLNRFEVKTNEAVKQRKAYYDNGIALRKTGDGDAANIAKQNRALSTTSGTAQYYHSEGTAHPYVPEANGYVYSYTGYRNDGNSNPVVQTGVGETFTEGKHDTRYYFASATQQELENIFLPGEVADAKFYRKNTTVDPNGQGSVSYVDPQGRTIATALVGASPEALEALPSNPEGADQVISLNDRNTVSQDETEKSVVYTITHLGAAKDYTFHYGLSYKDNSAERCTGCTYDFSLKVTDPLGAVIVDELYEGASSSEFSSTAPIEFISTNRLECEGEYILEKKLKVHLPEYDVLKNSVTASISSDLATVDTENQLSASDIAAECEICTTTDCAPADQLDQLMNEAISSNCNSKATDCDKAVCEANRASDLFDMRVGLMDYEDAIKEFGSDFSLLLDKDPYFSLIDGVELEGYAKRGEIAGTLLSYPLTFKIPPIAGVSCTESGEQTVVDPSSPSLITILSPGYRGLSKYTCNGVTKTLPYNVLYSPNETAEEFNEKKWLYYQAFYSKEKERIKADIPRGSTCTSTQTDYDAIYADLPKDEAELNDYIAEHLKWETGANNEESTYTLDQVNSYLFSEASCIAYETVSLAEKSTVEGCEPGENCTVSSYRVCKEYEITFNGGSFGLPRSTEELFGEAEAGCEANVGDQISDYIAEEKEKLYEEAIETELVTIKHKFADQFKEELRYTIPSSNNNEYHYTLYYYDQGGNLYKTVPPKGVTNREGTTGPSHSLVTDYVYNSVNQLADQRTPDAGQTKFYYDSHQQLRLSQNAKQASATAPRYSYTKYDALGRIIEVGEIKDLVSPIDPTNTALLDNQDFPSISDPNITSVDITKTHYDTPFGSNPLITQENLESRVSAVETFRTETAHSATTVYSYDEHGNVKSLLQDVEGLEPKLIEYDYDLVSGNVNLVHYQPGQTDEFLHRYNYDDDNRITEVETSSDGILWDHDAHYAYYAHGPLAMTKIGTDQIQKCDYHYTLQGWLKGINTPFFNTTDHIPDLDVNIPTNNVKDAFSMRLGYFKGDYVPTGTNTKVGYSDYGIWSEVDVDANGVEGQSSLYNGNIAWKTSYLPSLNKATGTGREGMNGSYYHYDQLNRIKQMENLRNFNADLSFEADNELADYDTRYEYDANGNILYLKRRDENGLLLANYRYAYASNNNRLLSWNGAGTECVHYEEALPQNPALYSYVVLDGKLNVTGDQEVIAGEALLLTPDFQAGGLSPGNSLTLRIATASDGAAEPGTLYEYDAIGNLTYDAREGTAIDWTVYNKVRQVDVGIGSQVTGYDYDGAGNRVLKSIENGGTTTTTHYVRDASGNIMATYKDGVLEEHTLYGSSRLGRTIGERAVLKRQLRHKQYEMTNHLGNVMAVVSDKLLRKDGQNTSDIVSVSDYYPFGLSMPGRNVTLSNYRYGFNGKEKDQSGEFGSNTHYDYGFRIYNPAIAKFLSVDPLAGSYPHYTPYQFAGNGPISNLDFDGLEELYYKYTLFNNGDVKLEKVSEETITVQVGWTSGNRNTRKPILKENPYSRTHIDLYIEGNIQGRGLSKAYAGRLSSEKSSTVISESEMLDYLESEQGKKEISRSKSQAFLGSVARAMETAFGGGIRGRGSKVKKINKAIGAAAKGYSSNPTKITVLHFTNAKGFKGITSGQVLKFKASQPVKGHPSGVFVTTKSLQSINKNNNGFKKLGLTSKKSEYFIEFEIDESLLRGIKGDRGEFIKFVPHDIEIPKSAVIGVGKTKK